MPKRPRFLTRRRFLIGSGIGVLTIGGMAFVLRKKLKNRLSAWTRLDSFAATPDLVPHDPVRDKATLWVSRGQGPAGNIDEVVRKMGGMGTVVGANDVVIIKVSAQWWNQGMTNVAAVKRTIEHILEMPGWSGDIIVFENTHFRLKDGSGLSRAWTHPSARNVDVDGWDKLGDLQTHFAGLGAPVSFVGLVDAGESELAGSTWYDPGHAHGIYGGDGRGPIAAGEERDGYYWDFGQEFRVKRSWVDYAQTPLTWPVFTCPRTKLVIDFKRGVFTRDGGRRVPVDRKLTWINMTTANAHGSTGFTGACKSAMGVVDMSSGRMGTHPDVQEHQSLHYFGHPNASWRMGGPLADFARKVRTPDLYLACAEWVAVKPDSGYDPAEDDMRHHAACAHQVKTVVGGKDAVAVDTWCVRNLLMPIGGAEKAMFDLDDPGSKVVKFLRYYRAVFGGGTLDEKLIEVV